MDPLNNLVFTPVNSQNASCVHNPNIPCDLLNIIQQARQNPRWLEQQVQQVNPRGYQQALQIRQSANPMQAVMQMAQANNVHPSILQYLGLR
jgi:hypothetical protein